MSRLSDVQYFVLAPEGSGQRATASRVALRAYADVIREKDAQLAEDITEWVDDIESEMRIKERKLRRQSSSEE